MTVFKLRDTFDGHLCVKIIEGACEGIWLYTLLIMMAYSLNFQKILGCPQWISSENGKMYVECLKMGENEGFWG